MQASQLMTQPVFTCQVGDSANEAARLMWEHDCGVVPVVRRDGSIAGIVTDRDLAMAAYTKGRSLRDIPVAEAMSTQVFTCTTTDRIEKIEKLMGDKRVRRVPVVDARNRPIGLLSMNDIVRHVGHLRQMDGEGRAVIETLSAISEPWQSQALQREQPRS